MRTMRTLKYREYKFLLTGKHFGISPKVCLSRRLKAFATKRSSQTYKRQIDFLIYLNSLQLSLEIKLHFKVSE